MEVQNDVPLAHVDGQVLSINHVWRTPRLKLAWDALLQTAIDRQVLLRAADHAGLSATVEELQAAFNAFRKSMGLIKADHTRQWLDEHRLTLDDLQEEARYMVLRDKVVEQFVNAHVAQYFHEHGARFVKVALARVLVAEEWMAAELQAQLEEEETTFANLVDRYSVDVASSWRGGIWGEFRREDLRAEVAASVFGAPIGSVQGPFQHADGWMLVQVLGRQEAVLDDGTRQGIRESLLQSWVDEQRKKLGIALVLP